MPLPTNHKHFCHCCKIDHCFAGLLAVHHATIEHLLLHEWRTLWSQLSSSFDQMISLSTMTPCQYLTCHTYRILHGTCSYHMQSLSYFIFWLISAVASHLLCILNIAHPRAVNSNMHLSESTNPTKSIATDLNTVHPKEMWKFMEKNHQVKSEEISQNLTRRSRS